MLVLNLQRAKLSLGLILFAADICQDRSTPRSLPLSLGNN
jgi:hypothetical protein